MEVFEAGGQVGQQVASKTESQVVQKMIEKAKVASQAVVDI